MARPVPPLAGVRALVKLRPAKVGVEVVVTDWSMEELPNRVKELLLPWMVMPVMLELVVVALEAKKPEIVEVPTVEVAMVDEMRELTPVRVVLPPWMERVLEAVPPEML